MDDATTAGAAGLHGRSLWADARRRILRDRAAVVCLVVIAVYGAVALGAAGYDWLAELSDKDAIVTFGEMADYGNKNAPPSLRDWRLLLGTDWAGKPVLIKTLLGAKVSISVGLLANLLAVPLGMVLGALAGFYGRWIDAVVVWLFSTLASIPSIILLIALKFSFKDVKVLGLDLSGIHGLYLALGVLSWIGTCRLVRAETLKVRETDYVLAARAVGTRPIVILFRHVLPNVLHLGIIRFSLGLVGAIEGEVTLSYLGLGVDVGQPSWGIMINNARMELFAGRWWELTAAVTAMFVLVLALNIFGDRLRDALDPRLKNA